MPKGKETIKYSAGGKDKFSFDKQDAASKTLAVFQDEQKHTGLTNEQLKEVWQLAKGTKEPEDIKEGLLEAPIEVETKEKPKGKK